MDGNDEIEYREFLVAATNVKQLTTNNKLQAAFLRLDMEGQGITSAETIIKVLNISEAEAPEIHRIVKEVSYNGLSEISFEEFVCMMKGL